MQYYLGVNDFVVFTDLLFNSNFTFSIHLTFYLCTFFCSMGQVGIWRVWS